MKTLMDLLRALIKVAVGSAVRNTQFDSLMDVILRDRELRLEDAVEEILASVPDARERESVQDRLIAFLEQVEALDWNREPELLDAQNLAERLVADYRRYCGAGASEEEIGSMRPVLLRLASPVLEIWKNHDRFEKDALALLAARMAHLEEETRECKTLILKLLDKEESLTPEEAEAKALAQEGRVGESLRLLQRLLLSKPRPKRAKGQGGSLLSKVKGFFTRLAHSPERERREEERNRRKAEALIQEDVSLIQAYLCRGLNPETIPEIRALFEDAVELAEDWHVKTDTVYDYASFLDDINDQEGALAPAQWYLEECRRDGDSSRIAEAYLLLGNLHCKLHHMEESEACYSEALDIRRRLAKENPAAFAPDLASTCNNLGILMADLRRREEAEAYYKEALDIRRRLAKKNPAAFEPDLAMTCNNLGILLRDLRRREEAEKYYTEALGIRRRLAKENPAAFAPDLASTCNNLGILMKDLRRPAKAEAYYREALDIFRRLAEENPAAFELYVAMTCTNLGALLGDLPRREENAAACYQEALDICRRLAKENPAFAPDLASTCFNYAAFLYNERDELSESKKLFLQALSLFSRYPYLRAWAQEVQSILLRDYGNLTAEERAHIMGFL